MLRPPRPQVLVVEDDPAMGALLVKDLGRRGFIVDHVGTANEALALLQRGAYTTVVSDVRLGGMTGLELCLEVSRVRPHLPFILITAFGDLETAISALRAGAHDFLPKPFEVEVLAQRIHRASDHFFLRAEINRLRELPPDFGAFEGMIGVSPPMQQVFSLIERVAANPTPVLITGETGTGKELAARAIHARSPRRHAQVVQINCSTTPESTFEGWLYSPGRPLSADPRGFRPGPFIEASGGTIILDEIGDLSQRNQGKLLRALQDRVIHPAGMERDFPFDVRLIGTSRKDLAAAVERGALREDLYYRLNVVQIDLPPLRQRGFDILALANEFIRRIAFRTGRPVKVVSPESAQTLLKFAWPGNVLELANVLEQAFAVSEHDEITLGDLPDRLRVEPGSNTQSSAQSDDETSTDLVPLDEVEKRYILKVVDAVNGNRTKAAEILRVDRKTLYTKLKTYGWRPTEGA